MKIPKQPPPLPKLWKRFTNEESLGEIMDQVKGPTAHGKYIHWDQLRHLPPPDGLDHEAWWFALKVRRTGHSKEVPLLDKVGNRFWFALVDPLPEFLHQVDSLARGAVPRLEPLTNPATRDSYRSRSLIEESITSSQLEGARTTRDVAKEMLQEGRRPRNRDERMIHNNYQTMQQILEAKHREMTPELVFEIHRTVTVETMADSTAAGRFRRSDERIVVGDDSGEQFHIPPPAEELAGRLEQMCAFANGLTPESFVHPVVRSMILHFWLAYDHPFVDGNGRTARALFYWSMLKQGYSLTEYMTISRIILRAPIQYGRAFLYTETDDNDLTYFLIYHAEVIRKAIDDLYETVDQRTRQLARAESEFPGLTALNHRQRDLIRHMMRHPGQHYTIEYHRNSNNVVYETARSDLMDLANRGLLQKRKRGKTWIFSPASDLEEQLLLRN